ncbi:Putative ribonuclease H protein At1g65750 [Linum perenne]
MRVASPSPIEGWDFRVSALIVPNGKDWDEFRVRSLFCPEEAATILSIPINGAVRDRRIWHYSRDGSYTVRSAYRLLREGIIQSTIENVEGDLRGLWRSRVPAKIKHMAWRASRGVLPTRERLQRRGIDIDWSCGICNGNPETPWHLFLECDFTWECWLAAGCERIVEQHRNESESFNGWIMRVIAAGDEKLTQTILTTIWAVWKERNERVWSQKASSAAVVINRATETISEWLLAQELSGQTTIRKVNTGCEKWHPPMRSRVKCNVDAAFFEHMGKIGLRACLRDGDRQLIQYRINSRGVRVPTKEAEAISLEEAMSWIRELGFAEVDFESDALTVVKSIKSFQDDDTEYGDIINRVRELLDSNPGFEIEYVSRSRNSVAHCLARHASSVDSPIFGSTTPEWLRDVMTDFCLEEH